MRVSVSLFICVYRLRVLFLLSLVFIRVQFRFYRSSCVPKLFATHLSLSLSISNQNLAPSTRFCKFPDGHCFNIHSVVLIQCRVVGAAFQQATRRSFKYGQSVS